LRRPAWARNDSGYSPAPGRDLAYALTVAARCPDVLPYPAPLAAPTPDRHRPATSPCTRTPAARTPARTTRAWCTGRSRNRGSSRSRSP